MLRLCKSALHHPVLWLAGTGAVTAIFGLGLTRLELRTGGAAIHPTGNPTVERTAGDRHAFNDPEQVILLLTSTAAGPAIESAEGFRYLKQVQSSLSSLPAVRGARARSPATLIDPPPNLRSLRLRPYLEWIPQEKAQFTYLVHRIHQHPLTDGLLLAAGGRAAAFYLPLAEGLGRDELVAQLEGWLAAQAGSAFALRLTGPLIAEATLGRMILRDLAWLIPLMVTVIAAVLYLSLGSRGGVLIPMAEVLVVLVWTLGAMAWCGVPITLVTTILPILVMTIAVTDEIHLLERFQRRLRPGAGETADREEVRRAMAAAVEEVGRPIILTSLTTSLGFLSFLSGSMAPIRHFGLFTSLGILLAMFLSFTMIPALVVLLPGSWHRRRRGPQAGPLRRYERLIARRGGGSLVAGLILVLAAIPGLWRLAVQDSWIDNFDPDSALVCAERDFNAEFWGSYRCDVVLASEHERYFHQRDGIRLLEEVTEVGRGGPRVGGVLSPLIAYRLLARTVDPAQMPGIHEAPVSALSDRTLSRVTGFANFLEKLLDLDQLIVRDGRSARVRLFVKSPDYRQARALEEYLDRQLPPLLAGRGVGYHLSGDLPVAVEVVRSIVSNQLRSIGWTLAGVALLLVLVYRSLRAAATLLVPLAAALVMMLGALGYAGVALGIATSMFTALTVGVGVDFSLHFAHAYRRQRAAGREHEAAVRATLAGTGRALRWNMAVLALGFLVLTLSALRPNHSLGILLAGAMLSCYAATLLLLPALLRGMDAVPAAGRPTASGKVSASSLKSKE